MQRSVTARKGVHTLFSRREEHGVLNREKIMLIARKNEVFPFLHHLAAFLLQKRSRDGRLLVVAVCLIPFCCCCCCSSRCSPHLPCYFQMQLSRLVSLSVRVHDDMVHGGPGELRGKIQRDGVVRLGLAKGSYDNMCCCCLWRWW